MSLDTSNPAEPFVTKKRYSASTAQTSHVIYLSIRTTSGFPPNGEILEIGLIDDDACELLNSFVKPRWTTAWSTGSQIHGILPEHVAGAPGIDDLQAAIQDAIREREVVTWNMPIANRSRGISELLAPARALHCVMTELAEAWHDGSIRRPRWPTFASAASAAGFTVPTYWNRPSILDCHAIRGMWHYLHDRSNR
jgi:hypothetical protein